MKKITYNLFLDDIRDIEMVYPNSNESDFNVVRNYDDFKLIILNKGLPSFISFDNDLGVDEEGNLLPDGYACAKWLVYESGLDLINLNYNVHSANPVASVQIKSLLDNYLKHLKRERQKAK